MPPTNEFTPNSVWADSAPAGVTEELTLPSGQTCAAVRMGMQGLLEAGILTEADSLTATVSNHMRKVKGANGKADGTELNEAAVLRDPNALRGLITMADKAIPHIVKSPKVVLHYETQKDGSTKTLTPLQRARIKQQSDQPLVVFTDQIGLDDKLFLFDWSVGGVAKATSFREESDSDVGSVVPEPSVSVSAKRPARRKR